MLHTRAPGSPSLNDTFGALLIGTYVGVIIYGLNLYQTARYFKAFPHDHLYLKVLVAVVLVLETWHTVLCMHMCYHYLVTNYFNPAALLEGCVCPVLQLVSQSLPAKPNVGPIRRFFSVGAGGSSSLLWYVKFRALRESCSRFAYSIRPPQVTFLLAELGLAMGEYSYSSSASIKLTRLSPRLCFQAIMVETFLKPAFAQFEQVTWIVSVAFGFSAIADIILTTVLICALRRCRTGIKRPSYRVGSASADKDLPEHEFTHADLVLSASIFDFLTFIFALVRPKDLIFFGLDIVAVKLYPTSLLTALNSRRMLAKQSSDAAAIYGDSGILVSESDLGRRPVLALSRRLGLRDLTRHETNGAEAIEMNVKANHCAGEVRLQPSVIEIGPLESGTTHSQAETASDRSSTAYRATVRGRETPARLAFHSQIPYDSALIATRPPTSRHLTTETTPTLFSSDI
ncbi:hypothetical protein NUW54_g7086 [Trametes sanguinea]|uniref:Uncharacterized protein n=1 Tax=Trametes sanguinea TaxID=158606 RepID=A0ACC1PSC4_9APHY|nr:hypothetical protein NUW54_g7086 [Trametes sanguinea]